MEALGIGLAKGDTLTRFAFDTLNKEEKVGFFTPDNDNEIAVGVVGGLVGFSLAVMQLVEAVVLTVAAAFLIIADFIMKCEYTETEGERLVRSMDVLELGKVPLGTKTVHFDRAGFNTNLAILKARLELTWSSVLTITRYPVDCTEG